MAREWIDDAIYYEVNPQSFLDTNADGIGDLPGVTARLDYIRDLGCNAIWLNPCFCSPFGDAGYDVSDYRRVAPRYGTNDDLARLFREAHDRGMRVLLDLVPGHTSIEHPWFAESARPEPNELSGRYVWSDDVWTDVTGHPEITGSLRGVSARNGCVAVNFYSFQPALNYGFLHPTEPWQSAMDSPEALATRRAMQEVIAFWLDRGCDGFRCDMAHSLVKGDPDKEGTIAVWRDVRRFLDERYPDAAIVSEWGAPDKSLRAGFDMDFLMQCGDTHYLDLTRCEHPFFRVDGLGDASAFVGAYERNRALARGGEGHGGLMCVISGNHDTPRLRGWLDEDEMRLFFAFQMTMPGVPFVYYGDEIGMRYLDLPSVEGGYGRTGSRSPMQWGSGPNRGFSTADESMLYTPEDPDPDAPTVEAQLADDGSLLNEVRRLTALRHATPALQARGDVEFLSDGTQGTPLAYLRSGGGGHVLVAVNPSPGEGAVPCSLKPVESLYEQGRGAALSEGSLRVGARSAAVIEVEI